VPDAFHVFLLGCNALVLSATVALHARTRYHAARASQAASLAREYRAEAGRYAVRARADAERLDLPRLLPFPKPPAPKLLDLSDGMQGSDHSA
jgi:hypothetical protein